MFLPLVLSGVEELKNFFLTSLNISNECDSMHSLSDPQKGELYQEQIHVLQTNKQLSALYY